MENLTVKELQLICKKLGVTYVGLKADIIERLVDHISKFAIVETSIGGGESPQAINDSDCTHHVTFITNLKRRIINPIWQRVSLSNVDGSSRLLSLKGALHPMVLLIGVFGGLHSLSQILLFYFGAVLQINLPRGW